MNGVEAYRLISKNPEKSTCLDGTIKYIYYPVNRPTGSVNQKFSNPSKN